MLYIHNLFEQTKNRLDILSKLRLQQEKDWQTLSSVVQQTFPKLSESQTKLNNLSVTHQQIVER